MPLLIDAAQTAGVIPIDMGAWQAAAVAFTGHKSMLAPAGIGGLVLDRQVENIETSRFGGTGIDSGSLVHTQDFPYRLEAGSSTAGIIAFRSLDYLEEADRAFFPGMGFWKGFGTGYGSHGVELYCAQTPSNTSGSSRKRQGPDPPMSANSDADFILQ